MNSSGPPKPNGKKYSIENWMATYEDIVLPPFQIRPVLVFTADLNFVEYAKRNNNFVAVRVSGTGLYDGEHFAIVDNFHETPNICKMYGPLKFTLTLQTLWRSYPFELGQFEMLKGIVIPHSILFKATKNRIIQSC